MFYLTMFHLFSAFARHAKVKLRPSIPRWSQSGLHFTRWQTCSFQHQLRLLWEAFSHAAITARILFTAEANAPTTTVAFARNDDNDIVNAMIDVRKVTKSLLCFYTRVFSDSFATECIITNDSFINYTPDVISVLL